MIVCIDCFKLFQQSPTKTKLAIVQAANQSLRIEHAQTSRGKNVFYILFERIINKYLVLAILNCREMLSSDFGKNDLKDTFSTKYFELLQTVDLCSKLMLFE